MPGADTCGLFDRADFLRRPELLRYLSALDASFAISGPAAVPARLMLAQGGTRGFEDWLQHVGTTVSKEIGVSTRISPVQVNNSQRN